MANLFENIQQFFLGKKEDPREIELPNGDVSFEKPVGMDGEVVIAGGLVKSAVVEAANNSKNDKELIEIYRQIARIPEVNEAIDEIVNEIIAEDDEGNHIALDLEEVELSDSIKKLIHEEFENILSLMQFDQRGHEYIKRWYIDGRIAFHKIVDKNKLKEGIRGLRYINPVSIEKVVEYEKFKEGKVELYKTTREYFRYTPGNRTNTVNIKGQESNGSSFGTNSFWASNAAGNGIFANNQILAISPDAIAFSTSGVYDEDFGTILSYLHPAIKVANNLSILEDSLVIYRMTRAPERRIFYVDVGNLPKVKGEQYVNDLMNKFKSQLTYDSVTGTLKDSRRFQSMMEDFWIPRRENGRATEITTLPGGQSLGQLDDVEYFLKKLYSTLKIPAARFNKDQPLIAGIGRSSEITRDEIRFQKFIDRLRSKFTSVFEDVLGTQLVLKKVMDKSEWEEIRKSIKFKWAKDSFFSEMKESEMLRERLSTLQLADPYIGKFITKEYVLKSILQVPEDEYNELIKALDQEKEDQAEEEYDQAIQQNDIEADKLEKTMEIQQQFEPPQPKTVPTVKKAQQ